MAVGSVASARVRGYAVVCAAHWGWAVVCRARWWRAQPRRSVVGGRGYRRGWADDTESVPVGPGRGVW